jgi:hypothetical protein
VALSAPFQATGVFVLNYEDELLLPFEGSGVETDWAFEMPLAANRFDYSTIADILITIEYTAFRHDDYRREVIARLGRTFTAERPFSLRTEFLDQWYDLHHPELVDPPNQPMVVIFNTVRDDFPPNLASLATEQLTVYFARAGGSVSEVAVTRLEFTEEGSAVSIGGAATTVGGIISTRQGSGASLSGIIGESPVGTWTLALTDPTVAPRFHGDSNPDLIEDILLVVSYSGQTPDWAT